MGTRVKSSRVAALTYALYARPPSQIVVVNFVYTPSIEGASRSWPCASIAEFGRLHCAAAGQGGHRKAHPREPRRPSRHQHRARGTRVPDPSDRREFGGRGFGRGEQVLANKSPTFGFDAQTEEYVDMLGAGIVDPAKVVRVALEDAASVAGLLITTEAMVAETPKKEAAPAMPGVTVAWAA
jgi:hypothetical protein